LHAYIEASNEDWGNPSSRHKAGREARALLEGNRATLASLLGVSANQLFFTACSTESNAIVLQSLLWSPQPGHVIIPSIEHNAVKGYVRLLKEKGWNVSLVDAPEGFVDPDTIASLLTPQTRMVAIMLVNNVTGTIQPVKEIVQICKDYQATHGGRKIHVHDRRNQALGKIPFRLTDLGVDSAAFSRTQLPRPKRRRASVQHRPGGHRTFPRRRAGSGAPGRWTENTGIAAMTVAVQDALQLGSSLDAHYEQAVHLNHMIRIELDGVVQFS
jgi:cysteine desulfurase